MSRPQNGRDMDRPSAAGGSVRAARERAQAQAGGLSRNDQAAMNQAQEMARRPPGGPTAGQSKPSRPQALQGRTGQPGVTISRPTQVPQWPLPGPIPSPGNSSDGDGYQPPAGRSQPPQRPPRPSRVPSILDNSRVQDHTPVFQYQPQNGRDSEQDFASSVPPTPSSRQTVSSVGSIPDFPVPAAAPPPISSGPPPPPPARRSVNLGPPPSARRGASSFYSNVSFVSPIPEESPRSRSHTSFASSAAMPESWGSPSPGPSPNYPDAFYEDILAEEGRESMYEDDGDESKLVRSASIGKRGKPLLVMNRGQGAEPQRPGPLPIQDPFANGTGFLEASSSSEGTVPSARAKTPITVTGPPGPPAAAITADAILGSVAAASATDPSDARKLSLSPSPRPFSRLSAIRRPPKLDMESVEKMNSRGSVTSLPDLIRRATRLAAMMDRGKRPASRFEDFDYPDEKAAARESQSYSMADERHQSGLSDMLAAFPPPAQATTRTSRVGSWFRNSTSWPLAGSRGPTPLATAARSPGTPESDGGGAGAGAGKRGRRCCGLPLWGFVALVIVVIGIVAAAVLVPLEFFVFRNINGNGPFAERALAECQAQLPCANGGTNVIARGVCSCICTNGFTGSNCTVAGATGCTTTNLVTMDESPNINDVTLGQAIPRLIADSQTNFSVPLSGTAILARFNTGSLSCIAQNSLVTFEGRSMRTGAAGAVVLEGDFPNDAAVRAAFFVSVSVITVSIVPPATAQAVAGFQTIVPGFRVTTIFGSSRTFVTSIATGTVPPTTTTTVTETLAPTPPPEPSASFAVTEEVLDFARVAVLFILQEDGLSDASAAQSVLQRFFTNAGSSPGRGQAASTNEAAMALDLGNGNAIDLINFNVNSGNGTVGARPAKRSLRDDKSLPLKDRDLHHLHPRRPCLSRQHVA